jgi:ubiquinone biosynthesis UbiH/UbiF/VisC/COQ6 family hydroxylase
MSQYDVIVVGGGLVGAGLALALGQGGMQVALVEQATPLALPDDQSWDARIYAITPGNMRFLQKLGVWDVLDAARVAPIHAMSIWGDDDKAYLEFDAYEAGVPELGFIAESRLVLDGLWRALKQCDNINVVCPAKCKALELQPEVASLKLEGGQELQAALVVGADGSNSWIRQQAGISVNTMPYDQLGIVANFETEKPHGNIARQWFLPDGILAWLPLPGNRISIVWSAFSARAQSIMALEPDAFCQAVAEAGHHVLGALRLITPPAAFPLRLQRNESMIAPRLALVGDAAHQVHPLSGQGVNLGFRDAQQLAATLLDRGLRDVGDLMLLRRYERARKADILSMQAVTTVLQKLFNREDVYLAKLRNTGLALTNHISPIKRQLMAHAIL